MQKQNWVNCKDNLLQLSYSCWEGQSAAKHTERIRPYGSFVSRRLIAVGLNVQRLESEDILPINSPRAPGNSYKKQHSRNEKLNEIFFSPFLFLIRSAIHTVYSLSFHSQRMIYKTPPWILGTLLGDGHIDPFGRLFIEHSTKQKAYFFHKFFKLQRMQVLSANYKL